MLVEGEGASQNDLDSYRGYLLVGSPIIAWGLIKLGQGKKYDAKKIIWIRIL